MKAVKMRWFLSVLMLAAVSLSASADRSVFFEILDKDNGLSNMAVSSIVQDSKGFLWFGTQSGLNRYDGYEFKVYKKEPFDTNSLSHDLVQTLFMDEDDILWIGTYRGLNRLDLKTDEITRYRNVPGDSGSISNDVVVSIMRDAEGNLWVGTLNGLNVLDEETGTFRQFFHDPDGPNSLSNNTVRALYSDAGGRLWIGTYGGLNLYRPDTDDFQVWQQEENDPNSIASNNVMAIDQTQPGTLWLGTWGGGGLSRFDIESGTAENFTLPDNRSYSLESLEDGRMYIGTWGGGLFELNPETDSWEHYSYESHDPSSLSHNIVYSLYMDQSDILWIGTNGGGINKLKKPDTNFRYWTNNPEDPDSISMGKVAAVYRDSTDTLWIGTYNGGLNRYDAVQDRMIHYRTEGNAQHRISNDIVNYIIEDSRGNLWVCTNQGLNRFNRKEDRFERWFGADSDTPLPDQIVYKLLEDRDRTLWIGTYNSGLVHYYPKTGELVHYPHDPKDPDSLSDNLVYELFLDSRENLWIGTNNGLNLYNREEDTFFHYYHDEEDPTTLTSNTVHEIYEDIEGNLWLGTISGGLNLLDRETGIFSHFMTEEGLPSNTIYGILEDNRGRMWMSTMNHLVLFDPHDGRFQTIDEDKGFWSQEFARGHYIDSGRNLLYFGSTEGLYEISPGDFSQNLHVPPVYLTSFKVFDKEVKFPEALSEIGSIDVDYRDKFIAFEFAALDYVNPQKNQYSYKLEGFDTDWINSGTRRYASYTNLVPGQYTFRVRASNNDHVWNMNGLEVDLRVIPPFYRTPWSYLIYLMLFIALIYFIIYEMNRLQRQRFLRKTREIERMRLQELEAEVRERRKVEAQLILARDEAQRANRSKSNFIANISHEIRTPLNAIIGYTHLIRKETDNRDIHDLLGVIKKSGNQLLSLINDLLDLSVIESGKLRIHRTPMRLDEVVEDIYSTYGYRIGEKGLQLQVRIKPGTPGNIFADAHRIRQILFNLVGNALKFTDSGSIEVFIEGQIHHPEKEAEENRESFACLRFRVKDTGIGIDPKVRETIFDAFTQQEGQAEKYGGTGLGLAITRELVEAMSGSIEVESEVGEGSVFTVTFPHIRVFDEQEKEGAGTGTVNTPSEAAASPIPSSPAPDQAPAEFTGEAENREALVPWLQDEAYPWWERISRSLFLDDWKEFSAALQEKGDEHGCRDLLAFGRALENSIAHSRIADLQKLSADFPKLIETIVVFPGSS